MKQWHQVDTTLPIQKLIAKINVLVRVEKLMKIQISYDLSIDLII